MRRPADARLAVSPLRLGGDDAAAIRKRRQQAAASLERVPEECARFSNKNARQKKNPDHVRRSHFGELV
jgi:hypothetical protein